ncbi:hypothetical protein BC830DRAFT_1126290 [Chytriomyces sp. MP71]|nr:hypothetical protein BC830DRAFT_1126290 [Chytriomyces sp. MP71]
MGISETIQDTRCRQHWVSTSALIQDNNVIMSALRCKRGTRADVLAIRYFHSDLAQKKWWVEDRAYGKLQKASLGTNHG